MMRSTATAAIHTHALLPGSSLPAKPRGANKHVHSHPDCASHHQAQRVSKLYTYKKRKKYLQRK